MGDALKKVQPGARLRIPAEAYNAFVDAARDYRQRQRDLSQDGAAAEPANSGIVLVKNNSGVDWQRFDVLGISGPIITPADNDLEFKSRPMVSGVSPCSSDYLGKFVVLTEPIACGAIGRGVIDGIAIAKVNIVTEEDRWAEARDGQTILQSQSWPGSGQILWKEAGTGSKLAIVRLGGLSGMSVIVTLNNADTGEGVTESGAAVHIVASRQSLQSLATGWPRKLVGVYLGTRTNGKPDVQVDSVGWPDADYQVLMRLGGVRVWDYPRAHP